MYFHMLLWVENNNSCVLSSMREQELISEMNVAKILGGIIDRKTCVRVSYFQCRFICL